MFDKFIFNEFIVKICENPKKFINVFLFVKLSDKFNVTKGFKSKPFNKKDDKFDMFKSNEFSLIFIEIFDKNVKNRILFFNGFNKLISSFL